MGSWSYVSGGKGFVCEESVARSRNGLMNWELSSPSSYVCSPQEGFVELGSQDLMRKAMGNNHNNNTSLFSESLTSNSGFTAIRNAFSREDESSSKLSISVVESNSRDSSLIDLKLGGFPDHRDVQNIKSRPAQSSTPAKRLRAGAMNSQTPYCQVQGCKKDLSSCKDYHKRHKVCEVHSKTAKVIVNGIEQRFCQQCSRFHLLAEFDDGKRSCRKRLAGHNERRRKPHTGMHSGRTGRLLQSYPATRFQGTGFSTSSFVCQDILPGNLMHQQKYEPNEWYRNVKVEEGTDFSPQLAIPGQPEPKSVFIASYNSEKHFPSSHHDVGISESSNSYLHDMAGPDFVPRYSLGSEVVLNAFDSSSTIPGISGISNSGCALSLLSSSSTHSLINPGTNEHYDIARVSRIGSSEDARLQQMMLFSNTGQSYGMNPIVQGSDYMNVKSQISGEDGGPTIDLLQLSSQLQRVEHEGHSSVQVKQESGAFSGLRIT